MNRGRGRSGGSGGQFNRRPYNGFPRYPANYAVSPYRQQHMNNWNYGNQFSPRHFHSRDQYPRYGNYQQYNQPLQEEEPLQTYYYTSGISPPSGPPEKPIEKSNETKPEDSPKTQMVFRSHKMTSEENSASSSQPSKKGDLVRQGPDYSSQDCSMAERLTAELSNESYECMICCEPVRVRNYIWTCGNCYNIFHLKCAQIWSESVLKNPEDIPGSFPAPDVVPSTSNRNDSATSSGRNNRNMMIADLYLHVYANARNNMNSQSQSGANNSSVGNTVVGWRCPACQFVVKTGVPKEYKCFCGKLTQPEFIPGDIPHTCGEMCGKKGRSENCDHPCTLLCHPGPCPSCVAMITKSCDCGKITLSIRCDKADQVKCEEPCGKELMCKKHKCARICHPSNCGLCEELMDVDCFCGKDKMRTLCAQTVRKYSCKKQCEKMLDCGSHKCEDICHAGECTPCKTSTSIVKTCHCGQLQLSQDDRKSCTDPIPNCNNRCGKVLQCGSIGTRHRCEAECHPGECPPCPLETKKRCRCGANTLTVNCVDLDADGNVTCNRMCKRKLHCNKHQCRKLCCTDNEAHVCTATCNRLLSCGIHYCMENCHRGYCDRCWETSFDDLTCHCGNSVVPAPVPCGTPAPTCDYPCMRPHPCGHAPQHNCHSEEKCPPCPVLIQSMCLGDHQIMNSVPCYIQRLSCGRPCGKGLPNCNHLCSQTCHSGPCIQADQSCQQKCQQRRIPCGHACDEVCHYGAGDCPSTLCKKLVQIICDCGRVKEQIPCHEQQKLYQEKKDELTKSLSGMSLEDTEEQKKTIAECEAKMERGCFLPCKDSCRRETWLRRLDDAFGPIENNANVQFTETLLRASTTGGYGEFVYELEQIFYNLVQSCMNSGFKQQHKFKPMNATRRQIIHELAEFYGLDTQAFDEEPHRHVAAFAYRNKVKIPPMSLTALASKRRVAVTAHSRLSNNSSSQSQTQSQLFNSSNAPMVLQRQHEQAFCRDVGNTGNQKTSSGVKSWSSAVGQGHSNSNSQVRQAPTTNNQWGKPPGFNNAMNYSDLLNESRRPQPPPQMSSRNQMIFANCTPQSNSDLQYSFGNQSLFSNLDTMTSNESSYQPMHNSQQFGMGNENSIGLNSQVNNWSNVAPVALNVEAMWSENQQFPQQQPFAGYFPPPPFIDCQSYQNVPALESHQNSGGSPLALQSGMVSLGAVRNHARQNPHLHSNMPSAENANSLFE